MPPLELARVPLFAGLSDEALAALRDQLRTRTFEIGETIFREGDRGDTLFVILRGLAMVQVGQGADAEVVARLRRGDVLGEMSLLTGEPRSATAVAAFPTITLELDRAVYTALLARHPILLDNLARLLRERLVASNQRSWRQLGQASALILGEGGAEEADRVIRVARRARAGSLVVGDLRDPTAGVGLLEAVESGDVLAVLAVDDPLLGGVLKHADRVGFVGDPAQLSALQARMGDGAPRLSRDPDPDRMGRWLARARWGLALGAGGARGYAHVGALEVLGEAGYAPDAVAGSSIGGVVGALVAMGMDPPTLEATMRRVFTPDTVAALFRLSLGPASPAMTLWTRLLREVTEDRNFSDLTIPLVVMCVDLESGQPAPLQEGPVWEALLATTALPGLAPPVRRGDQRLVDGLALVPVPTGAVEPLVDLTVAINLMSRDTLPTWPGEESRGPPRGASALDVLLEAMELTHIEVSTRHAARATVPITPRFGPCTWKDFHRADQLLEAGRVAARSRVSALQALIHPRPAVP